MAEGRNSGLCVGLCMGLLGAGVWDEWCVGDSRVLLGFDSRLAWVVANGLGVSAQVVRLSLLPDRFA